MKKLWFLAFAVVLFSLLVFQAPSAKASELVEITVAEIQTNVDADEPDGGAHAEALGVSAAKASDDETPDDVESVGLVEAQTSLVPGVDHDQDHLTDVEIDLGEDGSVAIEECEVDATATTHEDGTLEADANVHISGLLIKAPEGAPVEILVEADYVSGNDVMQQVGGVGQPVRLLDGIIVFDVAKISGSESYVRGLRVLDPETNTYTAPLDFNNSWTQHYKKVASLNKILEKYNLRIVYSSLAFSKEWGPGFRTSLALRVDFLDSNGHFLKDANISICGGRWYASLTYPVRRSQFHTGGVSVQYNSAWTFEPIKPATVSLSTEAQPYIETLPETGIDFTRFAFLALGLTGTGIALWRRSPR